MESLKINKINKTVNGTIQITGSKSETNRLLILQQFYKNLKIENVSNSDDSVLMQKALASTSNEINIGHAGTAMRFLTAFFAVKENSEIILTGSGRMKDRPIKILVEALTALGADIQYVEKEGFPPLKISGKKLTNNFVEIDGHISSQYISALLLIAPTLEKGLQLQFKGEVTSVPYIKMTLQLLAELGISYTWENNVISIAPKPVIENATVVVESDWSSASYYFSLVALSPNSQVTLSSYKKTSLQGDAVLAKIYEHFGVQTTFKENAIIIANQQTAINNQQPLTLDLKSAPDIAQTIAVTCFGLGMECFLSGLHTLKIKETDRLVALKNEIEKLGGEVEITNETLHLKPSTIFKQNISIATYDDHRMAMAFAPLAIKVALEIEDANVVSKSYPTFWDDFSKVTR
ncbi:3-phosphoshikimate 1-carboxyvinyltransferase [Lutibacter sp. HS1-25]|uniref:3-phosphoshikimate 1-carboxyvinyltransferase n=1 Tax=Lutibacter sp. HS1-25 TaxID=2485000 RepID=UPI0010101211|nr:3-phosphoshikimate 1-carboxyvinyltransferase [Lutibacter sp. HS1-25]RXP55504.1 3-phosphoshikimate 1-carboxyvinyltransferase [Lutibacter sp. HS1-25]